MMTSLDNLQRYKTEGEAMLERIVTGDETMGSSLSTGDKAGFKAMETKNLRLRPSSRLCPQRAK